MAKREMPSKTRFIVAAVYAAVTAVWFAVGLAGNDYAYFFALVWAALTAVWVSTGLQQRKIEALRAQSAVPTPVMSASAPASLGTLAQGEHAAAELRRLGEAIQNPAVRAQTGRLEETARKILAHIVLHPDKRTQARQFLDYYLPTSVKVLDAYRRMEGSSGPELQRLRGRIDAMLESLCAAFDRQLGALLRDEALDISADVTVLEQMLQQEGLGGIQLER